MQKLGYTSQLLSALFQEHLPLGAKTGLLEPQGFSLVRMSNRCIAQAESGKLSWIFLRLLT